MLATELPPVTILTLLLRLLVDVTNVSTQLKLDLKTNMPGTNCHFLVQTDQLELVFTFQLE